MLKTAIRDGCPVLQSTGLNHTVSIIEYLFAELCKGGLAAQEVAEGEGSTHYVGTLKKRKRENLEDPQAVVKAMLAQIPGLSAEKAAALLEVLPNLKSMLNAQEAELAEVKCKGRRIGPAAAKRLFDALHHGE
jgi:ERCC4-type nuclease